MVSIRKFRGYNGSLKASFPLLAFDMYHISQDLHRNSLPVVELSCEFECGGISLLVESVFFAILVIFCFLFLSMYACIFHHSNFFRFGLVWFDREWTK